MSPLENLDFVVNTISLVAILLSIYIFLSDRFRRWLFFGYKPTAIVIVMDIVKNNVLVIRRNLAHNINRDYPWHFPQGGIYSSDINGAVNNILNREFNLQPYMYDFEKTIILGVKKINERKIYRKYHFGSISLFSTFRGKGYVACVIYSDLEKIKKKINFGYGLDEIKIVNFDDSLKMIDSQKAQMLRKVSRQILE